MNATTTWTPSPDLANTAHAHIDADVVSETDAGTVFRLCHDTWRNTTPIEANILRRYTARAYDDDGELYYRLTVYLPEVDDDCYAATESLLNQLGSYAGCTYIRFNGHPELDVG